jgi:hypothetical protein
MKQHKNRRFSVAGLAIEQPMSIDGREAVMNDSHLRPPENWVRPSPATTPSAGTGAIMGRLAHYSQQSPFYYTAH